MNIKLKNLKINLTFSEETIMFKADLYINNYKAGYCENEGRGGSTYYHSYDSIGLTLIQVAEVYCKNLPPRVYDKFTFDSDLTSFIDDIVDEEVKRKEIASFEKKKVKAMAKGLVLIKEGKEGYFSTITWTGHNIESLLKNPSGIEAIKKGIIKAKLEGYKVANTNIPFIV